VSGAVPLPPTTGVKDAAAWFWVRAVEAMTCVAVTEDEGVTAFDGFEDGPGPVPAEFVALTVKV
jgi:hypothetical protein